MGDRNVLVSTIQVCLLGCLHQADISELPKAGTPLVNGKQCLVKDV